MHKKILLSLLICCLFGSCFQMLNIEFAFADNATSKIVITNSKNKKLVTLNEKHKKWKNKKSSFDFNFYAGELDLYNVHGDYKINYYGGDLIINCYNEAKISGIKNNGKGRLRIQSSEKLTISAKDTAIFSKGDIYFGYGDFEINSKRGDGIRASRSIYADHSGIINVDSYAKGINMVAVSSTSELKLTRVEKVEITSKKEEAIFTNSNINIFETPNMEMTGNKTGVFCKKEILLRGTSKLVAHAQAPRSVGIKAGLITVRNNSAIEGRTNGYSKLSYGIYCIGDINVWGTKQTFLRGVGGTGIKTENSKAKIYVVKGTVNGYGEKGYGINTSQLMIYSGGNVAATSSAVTGLWTNQILIKSSNLYAEGKNIGIETYFLMIDGISNLKCLGEKSLVVKRTMNVLGDSKIKLQGVGKKSIGLYISGKLIIELNSNGKFVSSGESAGLIISNTYKENQTAGEMKTGWLTALSNGELSSFSSSEKTIKDKGVVLKEVSYVYKGYPIWFYVLIITPIVLILIGIIMFIKRKKALIYIRKNKRDIEVESYIDCNEKKWNKIIIVNNGYESQLQEAFLTRHQEKIDVVENVEEAKELIKEYKIKKTTTYDESQTI